MKHQYFGIIQPACGLEPGETVKKIPKLNYKNMNKNSSEASKIQI